MLFFFQVPSQFTTPPPPTKTINEGQNLTLDCAASGTPTPNITWIQVLNNDNTLQSEGIGSSTLRISNIQRPGGSSGKYIYECQAKNIPGVAAVTKQTEVTVHCKYWHFCFTFMTCIVCSYNSVIRLVAYTMGLAVVMFHCHSHRHVHLIDVWRKETTIEATIEARQYFLSQDCNHV